MTNLNNSGPGSLRQAILANNASFHFAPNRIEFSLAGGGIKTIAPLTALPDLIRPVIIDGFTQPGSSPATNGNNPVWLIRIDYSNAGTNNQDGLHFVNTSSNVVRGLCLVNVPGDGIELDGGGGSVIEENILGIDILLPGGVIANDAIDVDDSPSDPATLNNTNRQTTTILNANDPALAGFRITRITLTPGVSALIEWNSVTGKTYRVQYKNSLDAPTWTDLPGDVTATTNTASKVDSTIVGVTERYYRVALVPGTSAPLLSISKTNNQLLISWPSTTPAGFILETTTNLPPVVAWVNVTNLPADNGTNKAVLLNIEPQTPARFYRLRQ